ncbi:MAG: Rieske 2Fe-2S domain-containing protein [Verrucomicrobiota bacterium]|nr:Rieske 2Fe-2S domain-containing protein [Verrucomicrobiota bacterium]
MPVLNGTAIEELIARHKPGFSLEQPFYADPAVFERDLARIFRRHWLFVDHASRIPTPGDYFLYEIAGESIILLRDRDGAIRAHYNVCRHRGSRICLEGEGNLRTNAPGAAYSIS